MLSDIQIKENHEICLELLDKFLDVCNNHQITYYLAFGSCLGTVRHKGFIPWDINIDVLMTLEEFNKLDEIMKKENLDGFFWGIPKDSSRIFPLLVKDGTWDYPTHPNLDFSIYCKAPNNALLRYIYRKMSYFNIKMYKLKNTNVKRAFPYNILKGMASIIPNSWYLGFVKAIKKSNERKTSDYYLVLLPSVKDNREEIKTFWFGKEPTYGEFEGRKVRILSGYDAYLTMRYGDYMTPKVWEDKGGYKHLAQ